MPRKLFYLLPLLTGAPLFLTGALRRPAAEAPTAFTPQAVALAPDYANAGAAALLDHATDQLDPARVRWLHAALWQRMSDPEATFEAEGSLQIGPDHCARLDVAVWTVALTGRWLVVSDGRALAHVVTVGDGPPKVTSRLLVPDESDGDRDRSDRSPAKPPEVVLQGLGCGGPYPLLRELRARLNGLIAETGLWQGRPVVRLAGRFDPARVAQDVATAIPAEFCYLYLDAQSLWPCRLEWWGTDRRRVTRPLLEMEFRDPEINRPLSLPECIQTFSYRPPPS
jgi:hypothetical protein